MTDAGGAGGRRSRAAILEAPLLPTLARMWWPMATQSLLGEAQGMISSFWIGQLIGVEGLATLTVLSPVLTALAFFAGAVPLGVQVLEARSTGSQDGTALPVIVNGTYLGVVWAALITLVGFALFGPLTRTLAGDLGIDDSVKSFLLPFLLFYIFPVTNHVALFAVAGTGWTRFGMIQSIISIGFLVVLMPVFAGVLGLGVGGIALSDGCSDALLLVLTGYALYKFRRDLGLGEWKPEYKRVDLSLWRKILAVGFPFQLARGVEAISQIVLIRIVMKSGEKATLAGYGLTMGLILMMTSVVGSVGAAASIIIGQNVGAGNVPRARACLRITAIWIAIAGVLMVVLAGFSSPLFRIFTDDDTAIANGVATMHLLRWAIPAGMMSALLLRSYSAVSPNKLGNALSMICASIAMLIALVWPGTSLERVAAALISSAYLRLLALALVYPRYFSAAIRRREHKRDAAE